MVDSLVLPKIPCMNTTALWDWAITCPSTQVHKIKPQEKVDLLNLCIIKTESTQFLILPFGRPLSTFN